MKTIKRPETRGDDTLLQKARKDQNNEVLGFPGLHIACRNKITAEDATQKGRNLGGGGGEKVGEDKKIGE